MTQTYRVMTANADKEKPGDKEYVDHLITEVNIGVLGTQERFDDTTALRGVGGVRVFNKKRISIGRIGKHRYITVGEFLLNGRTVTAISAHALHKGTVGPVANLHWLYLLAKYTRTVPGDLIVMGDFNRFFRVVARILGLRGHGVAVDGILTSKGVKVLGAFMSTWGKRHGYTDHPAYGIVVQ